MDRTHTELVSDKRELLNNGAGPAEPATTADQAATNSNYLWPPAHDYTGPKNSHLYGNGMYGGLEVAPAREKVLVERRLRREMAMGKSSYLWGTSEAILRNGCGDTLACDCWSSGRRSHRR